MVVKRFVRVFKAGGVAGVLGAVVRKIHPPQARCFWQCREMISGRTGLEIGGPSAIFAERSLLPIYPHAEQIDNINFARTTIWEDTTKSAGSFHFHSHKLPGQQFIGEAVDLGVVPDGKYDFLLSSHMIEHSANPLRALAEWKRVLKPDGVLVLVVPAKDGTFDHRRPLTTMAHLVEDFEASKGEDDLTHLQETLQLHDRSRDPGITDPDGFRKRMERNAEIRSMHHHVFDTRLVVDAVRHAGFNVILCEPALPFHIVVLARKPLMGAGVAPLDESVLREVLRKSPFPSDRQGL